MTKFEDAGPHSKKFAEDEKNKSLRDLTKKRSIKDKSEKKVKFPLIDSRYGD